MIAGFVRHRATVLLAVLCVFVFGTVTYVSLPREASPDVEIPVVLVTTPYMGVAPSDIESLITIPLESELGGLKDLKKMSSTSAEGASIVTLEFEPEVVIEDALQRVRDRVSRARTDLPDDAEETDIREVSFDDVPILILTIAGNADEEALKDLGEVLSDDIKRLPGVLDAKLSGGREREILIQVDPTRLQHYGLSLNDIIGAIADENINIPGGDVRSGSASFLVRVPGEFDLPREIEQVAVKRVGGRPVFVRDVAQVSDAFADRASYARMNRQPAVSIGVTKRTGANILEVADAAKALAAKHAAKWPEGIEYRVLGDQSEFVGDMVGELENGILTALVLVVAVIFFFMGVRNSLFVAMAIPLSMLLSMIFIWVFGLTLNMMVLFSLILALGMLVDNAIVLVENIYRHVEEGEDLRTAAVEGTREVAMAVIASTATTVAAFLPLVFWTGIMGQFMGYLPKTVIIVLVSSLAVAIVVLPVAASKLMKAARQSGARKGASGSGTLGWYRRMLGWSIDHRYISASLGVASLVGTMVAYSFLNHGTEFFPETEPNRATISVRAPDGTDLEATDAIVRQIERILARLENVDVFVAETGVAGGQDPLASSQGTPNQARITVDFLPDETMAAEGEKPRVESTFATIEAIRNAMGLIPGADLTLEKERMGPPVGKPIAVEVSGEDFHQLGEEAAKVRRGLAKIPGATGLSDDYRVGRPEMRLRIDRAAAKRVGASTQAIASTIRTAIAGTKASALREGEDEYDITVEIAPRFRDDLEDVLSLRIPGREDTSPETFPVPISAVASYELVGGSGSIRHIDEERVVTIEGEVAEGYNENAVRAAVQAFLQEAEAPEGVSLRLGGANDEQRQASAFLVNAFGVAIFLIALVLVTQFNRFDIPVIILASVLLSSVGVLWGLVLTGTPFGVIMTGLGVISLAGIVVNNAIVLLDYIEQLRQRGMGVREALIEAGAVRFRPVMLTALTTVLGLVPMAIGFSFDFRRARFVIGGQSAEWWGPMAVAVIAGLTFATVLTLVLVPTMYSIMEDLRGLRRRIFRRRSTRVVSRVDASMDTDAAE